MDVKTRKFVLISSRSKKDGRGHINHSEAQHKNKARSRKRLIILVSAVVLLCGLYCTAVFSDIPFVKYWRNIYIETAMDTFSHKWLATYFIPASVIDEVMAEKASVIKNQQGLQSSWNDAGPEASSTDAEASDLQEAFLENYYILDRASFRAYVDSHTDVLKSGYNHLLINKAGLNDTGTSIKTINGDQVLAIDAANGIIIVKVAGTGFVGKMAIVKDPSHVKLGISKMLGSYGQSVAQIAKDNDAVLAINASGFADNEGVGNGGTVVGLLISGGKRYNTSVKGSYLNIGFGVDDRLYIGGAPKNISYRDAVEFVPALIVNGNNVIEDKRLSNGSMGFGLQPRTAIGQTADGTVLMLTVDGRKPGYSIGCSVTDCADIFMEYGAVQASNLDGGSSTVMVYRGKVITNPSSVADFGRIVPDAFVVEYSESDKLSEAPEQ